MAGSRSHVTADDGTFRWDLIDNMGDAWEACEELFDALQAAERDRDNAVVSLTAIVGDAVNRLTSDSPMLLIDVRKLDAVVAALSTPEGKAEDE